MASKFFRPKGSTVKTGKKVVEKVLGGVDSTALTHTNAAKLVPKPQPKRPTQAYRRHNVHQNQLFYGGSGSYSGMNFSARARFGGAPSTQMPGFRTYFTVAQGSGRPANQESTVKRLTAFHNKGKGVTGGPGADSEHDSWWDMLLKGGSQSESAQNDRIKDELIRLCKAHDEGDTSIHLGGHSRGGGNAILLSQILHHEGLVHPETGKRYLRPGKEVTKEEINGGAAPEGKLPAAIVHSLNLVDSVPEMDEGHMTVHTAEGRKNVPYEHEAAAIPYNVKYVNNVEAESEERRRFRQVKIRGSAHPEQEFGPQINTRIVPNSVHSDVGGAPGFNPDAGDVSTYWMANQLHQQYPEEFRALDSDEVGQHNQALNRLKKHHASPGLGELAIGYATGWQKRDFTKDAKPMEHLEDETAWNAFEKEQSDKIGSKN
ncbi:hypothetical protein [uncultured Erythrobacter sp.]|uniref:hypothetical protein n=1 Tax=uncultured Erythrobacter sp. TaxID=263913 RepID=UPI002624C900|nr:hypothetical protein [uncultured Erythrobacter sp.]